MEIVKEEFTKFEKIQISLLTESEEIQRKIIQQERFINYLQGMLKEKYFTVFELANFLIYFFSKRAEKVNWNFNEYGILFKVFKPGGRTSFTWLLQAIQHKAQQLFRKSPSDH